MGPPYVFSDKGVHYQQTQEASRQRRRLWRQSEVASNSAADLLGELGRLLSIFEVGRPRL